MFQSLLGGIHFHTGLPGGVFSCSADSLTLHNLLTDMPWGSNMVALGFSLLALCLWSKCSLSLLQEYMLLLLLNGYLPL